VADKKPRKDELAARRRFREQLRQLARDHPALQTTQKQERLTAYLTQQAIEEQTPCPENPQVDREADQPEPDSSITPNA
jgi:hypothetical protein